ncbi:MAG: YcfL family protein [Magnetococcales bacterium]|nr:YcfL family protein [Magnetococcales bacterium]
MRFLPRHVVLIALAAVVAGCQTTQRPVAAGGPMSAASKIEEMGVMNKLVPGEIRVGRRNNLLNIQAEVVNPTSDDEQLFYRFKWLDASGFLAWDEEPWKPLLIHGQQKQYLRTVAPTPKAVDFRIEMHTSDNSPVDLFSNQPQKPL